MRMGIVRIFVCATLAAAAAGPANRAAAAEASSSSSSFAAPVDVRLATIRGLVEAGDREQALALAEEVARDADGYLDAWTMLAYVRALNGRWEASNAAWDRALELGADPADVQRRKAWNCAHMSETESARACWNQLVESSGGAADVLVQYASFELRAGDLDRAEEACLRVLDAEPNRLDAIRTMVAVAEARDDAATRIQWIDYGLERYPDDAKLLAKRARACIETGDYAGAVDRLELVIAADSTNTAAWRNLGIACYQMGNRERAADAFERYRGLGGDMHGLYGPLADSYRVLGRRSDALEVIHAGLAAGEQKAWLYSVWGKVLESGGAYDEAIARFRQAVAEGEEPWSAYARKQIARQEQLKKRAAAIAAQGAGR